MGADGLACTAGERATSGRCLGGAVSWPFAFFACPCFILKIASSFGVCRGEKRESVRTRHTMGKSLGVRIFVVTRIGTTFVCCTLCITVDDKHRALADRSGSTRLLYFIGLLYCTNRTYITGRQNVTLQAHLFLFIDA